MCLPHGAKSVDMDISARNVQIIDQLIAGAEESGEIEMLQNTISSSDRLANHLCADQTENHNRQENDPAIVKNTSACLQKRSISASKARKEGLK